MISDQPVVLLDLWLTIHAFWVEKKPLLSLLSIKSSPGNEKGGGDQQMMPELLEQSIFSDNKNLENTAKNPMTPLFLTYKWGNWQISW